MPLRAAPRLIVLVAVMLVIREAHGREPAQSPTAPAPGPAAQDACTAPLPAAADGAAADAPLFTFGLLTDVQYSDRPDGTDELPRVQRYHEAPAKLAAALREFRAANASFVLHLGDLVDGNPGGQALTDAEFEQMAALFDEELGDDIPALHLLGNHDAAVPRATFLQRLRFPGALNGSLAGYYSEELPGGWRLLALDTNELSSHSGLPNGSAAAREAQDYWAAHPRTEAQPQMFSWNGGIASAQLAWLQEELAAAAAAGERVIVASHNPLAPGPGPANHTAWNWEEVEAALQASPAFRLALSGHWHPGGYACRAGRPFVGVQAVLEAPPLPDGRAHALVRVYPDRLEIEGRGDVPSRVLAAPPFPDRAFAAVPLL